MRKLLAFLLVITLCFPCYAATQWMNGTGEHTILGSESAADIDSASYNNIVLPLDALLANYRLGAQIVYASASTLTVESGEVTLSSSDGSIRLMQTNAASTTVAWTDIDTGAEAASTTYYVWAFQATVDDADFDVTISTSSTAPSGKTYYRRLGSFYNDSSSNITNITNDEDKRIAEIRDYSTSTSAYTTRAATSVKMCYGTTTSVAGSTGTFVITTLPFTSSSSYVVTVSIVNTAGSTLSPKVVRDSGSQFTLTNLNGNALTFMWCAIGT